ncbi:MAG: efflux RND transporter periplasmic adaptor subunit [Geobacteraceae bacterium]|nr:efflux RND transporter periplasmic adaptor subunit [Geobacteraceae bacterium]
MKHLIVCMAALLALSLPACSSAGKNESSAGSPIPVRVGTPQTKEDHESVSVSGTVASPHAPSPVPFLVSGRVIRVGPREGEYVGKGQFLASLDPTDFRLALETAAAQTDMARTAYQRAGDELGRMKMLYDSKSLAPNDYQKYKAACESAAHQLEQAAASEKLAAKRLADATLRSPVAGFVSKRSVEPGQMASPGQPAFEIVTLDTVEVSVGVPETDIHLVRAGQKAVVTLPALPGQSFQGTVRSINVSADPQTRTFMTRLSVPNPKHTLRIGMVAEAQIRGDRTVKMLTLPLETIVRDPQGATMVYVYFPDRKRVYAKRVETGAVYGREIEIRKGLAANDRVILAGQERLRDGTPVSPEAAGAPTDTSAAPGPGARQ